MPRRPRSHQIADLAVTRVTEICNKLGWACEAVHKDYGEDLWIQTTIGEKVDHHRIWFQVKATDNLARYCGKDGRLSFPVYLRHALRWARNLELVVFILWDINKNVGYWALPQDQITELDIFSADKNTQRLFFKKKDRFTVTAARRLAWKARIEHYQCLLARLHQRITQLEREEKLGLRGSMRPAYQKNLVCYDFLRTIGFFGANGALGDGVGHELVQEMRRGLESRKDRTNEELCALATAVVIIGRFHRTTGDGIPGFLLWESAGFAGGVVNQRLKEGGLTQVSKLL